MADTPLILGTDSLRQTFPKLNEAIGKSNTVQSQLDQIVVIGSIDPETAQARVKADGTSYPLLRDRLNNVDAQLADIVIELDYSYPRLSGETNDLARLQRAVANIPLGSTLQFPNNELDLNNTDIVINRSINIKAKQKAFYDYILTNAFIAGSRVKNGGFVLEADNITIDGVGAYCPTLDNGFQANTKSISNLKLKNCIAVPRDHGFLIESYEGTVRDTRIIDCQSFSGVHGFISKADGTIFERCIAYNNTGWSFGVISDNIKGIGKNALGLNNKVVNCKAVDGSTALALYSRNYQGTDHDNDITIVGPQIVSFTAENCNVLLSLGDSADNPSYKTFPVIKGTFTNLTQTGTGVNSVNANYSEDCTIDGVKSDYPTSQLRGRNKNIKFTNDITSKNYYHDIRTFGTGVTPSVEDGTYIYQTNNNGTITDILGGTDHSIIVILFIDDNTTITTGGKFSLQSRYSYQGKGSIIVLKSQDDVWFELIGKSVSKGTVQNNLLQNSIIDLKTSSVWDITGTGTTTNKIGVSNKLVNSEILTLIIRSTSGSFTYGGFDSTKFSVPSAFPLTANFGTAIVSQWTYMNAISKWMCVSQTTAPY